MLQRPRERTCRQREDRTRTRERRNRRRGPIQSHENPRGTNVYHATHNGTRILHCFHFGASAQSPDSEPAVLHANKHSLHVKLPSQFHHSSLFPLFAFSSLPFLILSSIFSRSLSIFNLVMMTLLGAMPIGTLVPFDFSFATRSTCMTYFRR